MSSLYNSYLAFTPQHSAITDHGLSIMTNYVDDIDRFFHHRRFMHCFSPRFDLEDHARFYLLIGDVPGAKAQDITIEPRGERTLVISGNIPHSTNNGEERENLDLQSNQGVHIPDNSNVSTRSEKTSKPLSQPISPGSSPGPRAHFQFHLSSFRHRHDGKSAGVDTAAKEPHGQEYTMLLNERLGVAGNKFNRTFTLPMPMEENAVQASVEDGILRVLITKKEDDANRPVRIVQVVQL